jgi:hypothetical protein
MQDRTKTYLVRPKLSRIETKRTKLALIPTRSKRKRSSVSSRIEAKKKFHNVANKELYFLEEPEEQYTLH